MVLIDIPASYGYVVGVAVGLWIQQILFTIPVGLQRSKTGIKPPTLYPNDKLITTLKLSPEAVDTYNRTQRVHQNNMEFLVIYFPMLLLAGIKNAEHAAIAGAVVIAGRFVTALGYYSSAEKRILGGWFHIPELYTVYLAGKLAFDLISAANA
mmetsp:Transcript_3927/g.6160  ORF Transcript_3927/g.6160 Transcript_3927/m.6160 type:complete len:153 (-) Transcript_3927:109-567(-)|eukprot:CAMPEP_0185024452 /NCGR_PEP_ID=MMETSP1103-20130426/7534_1 /TAXON_ID=36769 /ORGANISM="Paraphysomonas bandaiensis, Strain Caron Lab Isolate" /LENGTH=152 /DNA_ID=CAMNT_0027557425 /DNA_START=56 /DNA_END=514 /DNA_ORIENTATION=+